jgi:hypothetical protein
MNSEVCMLQLVVLASARGLGRTSALVRAQQVNQGALLSGAT